MADNDAPKLHVPNPAAWLGRVWDRMPGGNNDPALKAWMQAFGLKDNDPRVLEAVACFVDMGQRTRTAVLGLRGMPADVQEDLLSWHEPFDQLVHITAANGAWNNIRPHFNDGRRKLLRQCEMWLNASMWTAAEEKAQFQSLLEAIEALKSEVQNATIADDFRALLLDMIEALRRAIAEYDIRGSKGVFASMGEILALRERYASMEPTAEASSLYEKMKTLVRSVAAVGSVGSGLQKVYAIGHQAFELLAASVP